MGAGGKLTEAQIQHQVRSYLAALGIDAVHVPNGSVLAGDKVARAKQSNALKRAGVLPGFPDLILFDRRARRVGFIEIKKEGGRVQPSQKVFAERIAPQWGWPYAICRSVDDMKETLHEWGWR